MTAPADLVAVEGFLRDAPLFRSCDPVVLAKLAPHVELLEFPDRAHIFRAGTPGDALGLLMVGRATVVSVNATTGATTTLETLDVGDHFGEVGVLLGGAHVTSVVADEPAMVVRLRKELVDQLMHKVPSFTRALARRLAARQLQLGTHSLRPSAPPGQLVDASQSGAHALGLGGSPSLPPPAPRGVSLSIPPPPATASSMPPDPNAVRWVEVADFDVTPKLLSTVPERLIHQHRVLPLQLRNRVLTLGMVAPRNYVALAEIRRVLQNVQIEIVAISVDDFHQSLARLRIYEKKVDRTGNGEPIVFDAIDGEREAEKAIRVIGDEVIRYVNRILYAAIERDASDVHVEPEASAVRVRFRVQGVMQVWNEVIPASMARGLVARFKVLAGLDITDRRTPQDGRIALTLGKRELDLRIATLPVSRGEKLVLRICDAASMMRALESIFVEPQTLSVVRRVLQRPSGAIILAGSTGSGKTSTLYSLLHERRQTRADSSVVMVEDPIEYRLSGVSQVQVNASAGLGFAQVLRAVLRQDPDVIAVGEMRDVDTAQIAMESAITGHLVLTSMHAHGAVAALQRLQTMGVPLAIVAQATSLVVVQKLVRRLCAACVRMEAPSSYLLEGLARYGMVDANAPPPGVPRPTGCDECSGLGYKGRVVVVEALLLSDEVRDALMSGATLLEVEKVAKQSRSLQSYAQCAGALIGRKLLSASDALLVLSE